MSIRVRHVAVLLVSVIVATAAPPFEADVGLPLLYHLRGERSPEPGAVVVAIDQNSVDWMAFHAPDLAAADPSARECLPPEARMDLATARNVEDIPRAVYGCLLEAIAPHGPAAVALDVHFAGPSDPINDGALRRGLASASPVILLEKIESTGRGAPIIRRRPTAMIAGDSPTGFFAIEFRAGDAYRWAQRLDDFPDAVDLASQALAKARGGAALSAPLGEATYRNLNLYGPPGTIPTITAREILADPDVAGRLAGAAVFIGSSQPGGGEVRDRFETAYSSSDLGDLGGVEIVATAYLNLREDGSLTRLPMRGEIALTTLVGAALFGAGLLRPGVGGAFFVLAAAGIYVVSAAVAFGLYAFWAPLAGALALAPVAALLAVARGYLVAEALVHRVLPSPLREAFGRGAPADAETVHPQDATVVVVDMTGSTGMAARFEPAVFASVMSHCLEILTEEIERGFGTVIKYTGDGLVAVFIDEFAGPDHAGRAISTLRAAELRFEQENARAAHDSRPRLHLRAGLDSGPVVLGAIGTEHRGSVDVIGDPVHVASRLEQLGKDMREIGAAAILLSDRTAAQAAEASADLEDMGEHQLRGRPQPVRVFRVLRRRFGAAR